MKILVTGGVGFIGTNLIKKLILENHDVYSLDNYSIGSYNNELKGCTYVKGDLSDIYCMDKDFDIIFHLAALSRIQPSFINPFETYQANVEGTQHVCEFAKQIGAKVIYAGSSSRWHDPYQSPYATYKHIGEEICKMYKKSFNLDVEIARFYNVYGPYEVVDGDYAAVMGIWRRQVRDGQPITIVGDGEQRRDFTHVDDIVDGLCRIAFSNENHEDAWELGTGFNYSLNEVYEMFEIRFGCGKVNIPDQYGNYRETRRVNNDALKRLGWKPGNKLKSYILNL